MAVQDSNGQHSKQIPWYCRICMHLLQKSMKKGSAKTNLLKQIVISITHDNKSMHIVIQSFHAQELGQWLSLSGKSDPDLNTLSDGGQPKVSTT